MKDNVIYADNAATTRMSDTVLEAMLPYMQDHFGNASAIYKIGREAHQAVEQARKRIAAVINAGPMDIYFTSCGTEADNWAVKGMARKQASNGKKHIITTAIEHHAILHSCAALEKEGFEVTYLPVDEKGRVTPDQVSEAIREDTALVTIMYANNEIGTIEPVAEIGQVCRDAGVFFHTDAEGGVRESGEVVADVDMVFGHVDNEVRHWKLANLFLLLGLQDLHETKVLGGHLAVLVAEQDIVGGFFSDDDEPDSADAEKSLDAFFNGTDGLLVEVFEDDDDRVEFLKVRHATAFLLRDELVDGAMEDSISQFVEHGYGEELIRQK